MLKGMNSAPFFYRDFGVAGELTHRPRGQRVPAWRGLLRLVVDAIERSRRRAADREIARVLGGHLGPDDRLTDEMERRLLQHLTGDRGFRP
jgi:hypothetical protein